jgi:TPR repeat protein
MRSIIFPVTLAALVLGAGCASQSAESQLKRKETVRVCVDGNCSEQASSTVTFQPEPVDAAAEQRLQALGQLAEQDPKAAYDLGLRLLRGDGVLRDSYQGIQWLRKAGDGGLLNAQLMLGQLYFFGYEEMGADFGEAEAWLSRAAVQGSTEAQQLLPEARAGRQSAQNAYQVRESQRKNWGNWFGAAPYYWYWQDRSWYLR